MKKEDNSIGDENVIVASLKTENGDFQVEYDILAPDIDPRQKEINAKISEIDYEILANQDKLNELDDTIERLTNHADGVDYSVAVISGIVTGIIDATIVGSWDFKNAKTVSSKNINNKVIQFAKKHPDYIPYCNFAIDGGGRPRISPKDPNRLETAISFLEWKYHLPGDGDYRKTADIGIGGATHRLDDLCHHPTLVGLICSIVVQFTGETRYVNKYGEVIKLPVTVNEYGNFVGNNFVTKLFAGIINWFITCAKTVQNWHGHLMSDIATPAGLPGSFLSIITELASIPCFQKDDFLEKLRRAYKNGIGTSKGQVSLGAFNKLFEGAQNKLDVTTELAIKHELRRQAVPVVLNEIFVRATYFVRHFICELKEKKDVLKVEWKNVIPFDNRTIVRMMTIASGTFTAIDMADAAIHAAGKSVDISSFFSNLLLRVNFVGIGRVTVAVATDIGMGIKREIKRDERMSIYEQQIALANAKIFYKQAGVWISAQNTGETILQAYSMMEKTTKTFYESFDEMKKNMDSIYGYIPNINKKNPGLTDDIIDILD